jgi:hypothetical protein
MEDGVFAESNGGLIVHLEVRCSRLDSDHVVNQPSQLDCLACCYGRGNVLRLA